MSKVYVFLADGFEEIEGLTVVDLLRRAGEEVETVSIMGRKMIEGAHKIKVEADLLFEETDFTEGKMWSAGRNAGNQTSWGIQTADGYAV